MENLIEIQNLGYEDPIDNNEHNIETYSPGNNTGLPRYRVHNEKLYLYISASLIAKFVHLGDIIEYCPKQIYTTVMLQQNRSEPTLPMLRGSYFESQCLGGGAGGKMTDDLPRKKNGIKTVAHNRIDDQITMFKHLYPKMGMVIMEDNQNTQVRAKKEYKEHGLLDAVVYLTGEADWLTPYMFGGEIYDSICVDIKLPGDLTSDFGKYAWGKVFSGQSHFFDFTQATMYWVLFEMKFAYWLFDYKSSGPENKLFFVNHDINDPQEHLAKGAQERIYNFKKSLNNTIAEIITNFRKGWPTEPNPQLCSKCPIEDCISKINNNII